MANIYDVATYVEELDPQASQMKVQKLVYYAQAWALAWSGRSLIDSEILAWKHGPVIRELWDDRSTSNCIVATKPKGDAKSLGIESKSIIKAVFDFYGHFSAGQLRNLSHAESPWADAWEKCKNDTYPGERISKTAMLKYYSKKALTSPDVPQRAQLPEILTTEAVIAQADEQIIRWQSTLDWLAVR